MNLLRRSLIWVVLGLGVLAIVVAGIGMTMEADYQVTRQATFASTPEEIWTIINRFDQTPRWRSDVHGVGLEPGTPIRFVELGDGGPLPLEVQEQEPLQKLVLVAEDPTLRFYGTWTFEFEASEEGTRLSITERGHIDNPLHRFVARTFGDPSETVSTYLVDLGRHLGEEIVPQAPEG